MAITIKADKTNKETVLGLISNLIDSGSEGEVVVFVNVLPNVQSTGQRETSKPNTHTASMPLPYKSNLLSLCDNPDLKFGDAKIEKSEIGAWGMFNSFLPGKSALRILANMMKQNPEPIKFDKFMKTCIEEFRAKGLSKYRGFPKNRDSAISRTELHLIRPFADMGLIEIRSEDRGETVAITRRGLELANLPNPVLDEGAEETLFSQKEKKWLIDYLKEIDVLGYKEYSLLTELVNFLKVGKHTYSDIHTWFSRNKRMLENLKTWSRKTNDKGAFEDQIANVAATFVSGKIALLRELGVVRPKRNDYAIIGWL